MQLWLRKQLRGHTCQITLALVKKKYIYIYTTRFPGCLPFQSRAWCPQSVSSGSRVGGWLLLQSLQLGELHTRCQALVVLRVPHRQRAVTAAWPWSFREARSLGSDSRHFQGPAHIPQNSAGCVRNKVAKCWELEPFPCCCRESL